MTILASINFLQRNTADIEKKSSLRVKGFTTKERAIYSNLKIKKKEKNKHCVKSIKTDV